MVLVGDGGGKAQVLAAPPTGRLQIARLFAGLFRRFTKLGVTLRPAWVNGRPGALFHDPQNRIAAVMSLDLTDGAVHTVRSVVNPDKLRHLGPVSDVGLKPQTTT
ncbi:MAG TPA: hypothetical protein VN408_25785 [Actinoplanes sp.]|nr:hypothetical protein [Actinoplanes sp.]